MECGANAGCVKIFKKSEVCNNNNILQQDWLSFFYNSAVRREHGVHSFGATPPRCSSFQRFHKRSNVHITKIHWNGSNWQKSQYLLPRENISNISRGCFLVKTMDVCHTSSATRLTYCWCSKVTLYLLIIIALLVPYAVMSDKHSDIPHICHHRHHRRRCTFFQAGVPF